MTDIPNRYFLENSLTNVIENVKNDDTQSALLFIDLDNFKVINDTYGHDIGDKVLIELSKKLIKYTKENNLIARLGGDEFGIIMRDTSISEALLLAEDIRSNLESHELKITSTISINITTSIGVVKVDGNSTSQTALAYADTALYSAKDNGKNRVVLIASDDVKEKLSQCNRTIMSLTNSLKDNKFILMFQPIVDYNYSVVHYEALIRLMGDDNTLVSPNEFIPVAEKFGLVSQIDKWVFSTTLKIIEDNPNTHIFINLSGLSLNDSALLSFIEKEIQESSINPAHLGFEITETTAVTDLSQSKLWIERIKKLGCEFALDDFGVGFSSFTHLSELPVDYLKIDGSFVKNIVKDPKQKEIVQAMNAVAHALGKHTIAEYVENKEIMGILQTLDIDYLQGYYIGKPAKLPRKKVGRT